MNIAIVSDSHDNWEKLEEAVNLAERRGCEYLLFAGDLISPAGIDILAKFNGKVKFVWGNNEGEKVKIVRKADSTKNVEMCGDIFDGEVDGVRIFMNHYPEISLLAAKSGDYGLAICGHTHEWSEQKFNDCTFLNVAAVMGEGDISLDFAIFDTKSRGIERVIVYKKKR